MNQSRASTDAVIKNSRKLPVTYINSKMNFSYYSKSPQVLVCPEDCEPYLMCGKLSGLGVQAAHILVLLEKLKLAPVFFV